MERSKDIYDVMVSNGHGDSAEFTIQLRPTCGARDFSKKLEIIAIQNSEPDGIWAKFMCMVKGAIE